MAKMMYALKSEKVGPNCLRYGLATKIRGIFGNVPNETRYCLYYLGERTSGITGVLTAAEASSPLELGRLIEKEHAKIISKTGTENITFEKSGEFPDVGRDIVSRDIIRYYEMTKKEQETVIRHMYITKNTIVSQINES